MNEQQTEQLTKRERKELRREERAKHSGDKRATRERLVIWGVAFALIAGIVGLLWYVGGGTGGRTYAGGDVSKVLPDDHIAGTATASTTLIEYSDFQCPACSAAEPFIQDTLRAYGDKIRVIYRHFPLTNVHANAQIAAQASEAASLQGKFWQMHGLLFAKQGEWENLTDPTEIFARYAEQLSLDVNKFKTDLQSDAVKKRVEADSLAAISYGINATPTFYLNGYMLDLPSFAAIKTAVAKELGQ